MDSPADVHDLTEQKTFTFIIYFMPPMFGHKRSKRRIDVESQFKQSIND